MITVGFWRWPLVLGLALLSVSLLAWRDLVRLRYEGQAVLVYGGDAKRVEREFKLFEAEGVRRKLTVALARSPDRPLQLVLRAHATTAQEVAVRLDAASQTYIEASLAREKKAVGKQIAALIREKEEIEAKAVPLARQRRTALASASRALPRVDNSAKIKQLQNRRQQLIERYPSHTDIPLLAKQIKELQSRMTVRPASVPAAKVFELSRGVNEAKVRTDYFSRRIREFKRVEEALKPSWKVLAAAPPPRHPVRVEGWPLAVGLFVGLLIAGALLFRAGPAPSQEALSPNGLWRPEIVEPAPRAAKPVELAVVSVETAPALEAAPSETLPSDPLTEKAAALYAKWVEVAELLYRPAPEPPQDVLGRVGPLLQESSDFLPQGHDVLAKYLARTVAPGDLSAHVARTVLMTLTGAEEAGASPEHRLAMALAALFHDLAMVPRPAAVQEEAGSEVGRLSAGVLRRIPGLQPAILSMVEEILIGMDEFKLETWQNVASGSNLEPLSKVLREIDRFEKLMQKQRTRLDRQVTRRMAS